MHHLYDYMYTLGFEPTTLVATGTDCTDSCKSNYHTITTTSLYTLIYSFKCLWENHILKTHTYIWYMTNRPEGITYPLACDLARTLSIIYLYYRPLQYLIYR